MNAWLTIYQRRFSSIWTTRFLPIRTRQIIAGKWFAIVLQVGSRILSLKYYSVLSRQVPLRIGVIQSDIAKVVYIWTWLGKRSLQEHCTNWIEKTHH